MAETFSAEEQTILLHYFSNVDRDVFVLSNLPESVKGALFSRYSRSPKSVRRLLLDEFLNNADIDVEALGLGAGASASPEPRAMAVNKEKANAFFERVLDGYGDDSVGELGGCHIALENISIVATKEIQDARIGGSPLEKSTRYVYFDQKGPEGDYLFYKEPRLMASDHKALYLSTCRMLFDTYAGLMAPLNAWMEKQFPADSFEFMVDPVSRKELPLSQIADEAVKKRALSAYKAALRANVCDVLRYLLPAGTQTNVGLYGNGRFFEYLLRRLYSHPLSEMQDLGSSMHRELDTQISAFVRRAKKDDYLAHARHGFKKEIASHAPVSTSVEFPRVQLAHFDAEGEKQVLSAILFESSSASLSHCQNRAESLSVAERKKLVDAYVGNRRSRRDRPGRAFENAFYEFEVCADYGAYRDIQRHRLLTQDRQVFSTRLGYELPREILGTEFESAMRRALEEAAAAYEKIAADFPLEAQYVVPLGYRIRWRMKLNLREAVHFCELRSVKQGHPSYRDVAQRMARQIMDAHPLFAGSFQFVDWNEYQLGRLSAEMGQEHKRAKWAKNTP